MHAEPPEFMGQAYGKAPMVTGNAPISPLAALISTDTKEAGLWLWQGEVPPSPPLPGPKSRDQQILRRIMPAAGWAGWIAVPAGLALAFLAVSMMLRPDRPVSADRPAVALSSAPPAVMRPIVPVPPDRAHGRSIGSGASPSGAGRQTYGARARTASGERACTTQIVANREKNSRLAWSQRAAIPVSRSAYATGYDMARWWLLTRNGVT
jgi:hypothetical protein